MTHSAENDARGIIYIDAPLPATVLNEAYRMNAEWDRRHTGSDCYGCFWDMRPGPWHTCVIPPEVDQS